MGDSQHLWVTLDMKKGDERQVIIDKGNDIRVCDGSHVIKIRFKDRKMIDVLVDDKFVYIKP